VNSGEQLWNRVTAAVLLLLSASEGRAQSVYRLDEPLRPEDLPVSSRTFPEAAPIALRFGNVLITPRAVGEIEVTSNLFATPNDPQAETVLTAGPGALLEFDSSTFGLTADMMAIADIYLHRSDLSTARYSARLEGIYRPTAELEVFARAQSQRLREDPIDVERQLDRRLTHYRLHNFEASIGRRMTRLEPTLTVSHRMATYEKAPFTSENRSETRLSFSSGYQVAPKTRLVGEVTARLRTFPNSEDFIDSEAYSASGGVEYATHIWLARAVAGVVRESFDGDNLNDFTSWIGAAELTWSVTRLTTLSMRFSRELNPATASSAPNRIRTSSLASVDHEFLRNLFLRAEAEVVRDRFLLTRRQDRNLRIAASARYFANQRWHARLLVEHGHRGGSAADRQFERVRAVVAINRYF
jgi:hypothetical protein